MKVLFLRDDSSKIWDYYPQQSQSSEGWEDKEISHFDYSAVRMPFWMQSLETSIYFTFIKPKDHWMEKN